MKKFIYKFLIFLVKIFCRIFFRIKVIGKENIPKEGALILCANHTSNWDLPFLFCFFPREVRFIAKEEIFSWFFIGSLARFVGAFPVKRGKADLKAMKTALEVLKKDEVLGIFPEGTRMHDEDAENAKAGVALFAYQSKADILPCYVDIKDKKVRPFCKVIINYGKVIKNNELNIDKKDKESFSKASVYILDKIYSMSKEK